MLANPHWDAPSMSSFESWLETKNPNDTYPYSDCERCACAQYLQHIGKYEDRWLGKAHFGDAVSTMNRLAGGNFDVGDSHTFGALLERVREHRQLAAV